MTVRLKHLFIFITIFIVFWFLYAERALLTPVILGAIFAYLFNPIVNFFSEKIKLPRGLSVVIIYLLIVTLVVSAATILTRQLLTESSDIRDYVSALSANAKQQVNSLPDFIKPTVNDFLVALEKSRLVTSTSLLPFFPKAISRIISFLIFAFSGYYFLKEGGGMFEKGLLYVPAKYKVDVEILIRKINSVLGGYLRGQMFLVFLMSIVTFLALSILGVRFALFIAIFSGFAEIVPVIGPIIAGALATLVVLFTGTVNFGLSPFAGALIVVGIYFVLRHSEDYFIVPHIMGKITKLPPFIIFFAVIAGGHLWGIMGLILAVPCAAIIKLLLEFFLDQTAKEQEEAPEEVE
jgi:predicted PurR-regulated permease PerM